MLHTSSKRQQDSHRDKVMNKRHQKKKSRSGWFHLIPPIVLLAVYPLVLGGTNVTNILRSYPWYPDSEMQTDFFVYAKSLVFLALVVCMLLILLDAILLDGNCWFRRKIFRSLYIYGGLAIVSTVLSVNRTLSLRGMWEQHETVFVLLGYAVTAIYMAVMVQGEKEVHLVHLAAVIGAFVQGLIGTMQLFGLNVLESRLGKALLTMHLSGVEASDIAYNFGKGTKNHAYMTLYNPNYAAVYIVLLLPIVVSFAVRAKKKGEKKSVAFAIVTIILLMLGLIGTGSRTGMGVTAFISLCVGIRYLFGKQMTAGKKTLILLGLLIVVAGGLAGTLLLRGETIQKSLKKTITNRTNYKFQSLEADGEGVHIGYGRHTLLVVSSDRDIHTVEVPASGAATGAAAGEEQTSVQGITPRVYIDGALDAAPLSWDEDGLGMLEAKAFRKLRFNAFLQDGYSFLFIRIQKSEWYFIYDEFRGSWMYVTAFAKTDSLTEAKNALPGWEKAFTERGYIWGRTLPLLPKYLLWGSGPDTFTVVFPQSDYRMKANTAVRMLREVLSRPHSMYIQSALHTGMLSLVCLLIFWAAALHTDRKRTGHLSGWYIAGIAYLLMGLLNDSFVGTAPLFWAICGLMLRTNDADKAERKKSGT